MNIIHQETFGVMPNGTVIEAYTLVNENGIEVKIMNYGGTVISIKTPDHNGDIDDIVLGFDKLAPYLDGHPYFGSLIGRYANRIAKGIFQLNEKSYQLNINNGLNHLHGGPQGFHTVVWNAHAAITKNEPQLVLNYLSINGEEGYPGNLSVEVSYTLTNNNDLIVNYKATTDRATIVNLTNHTYFNLSGSGNILNHSIQIAADRFLPIDKTFIPLGEFREVNKTPMDFRGATKVSEKINLNDEQLTIAGGYDHNWIINKTEDQCKFAAYVYDPVSRRTLKIHTTQPGLQFYTGNFLDGSITGKRGQVYKKHSGLCLEPHHFPNSPNNSAFPSTVLEPHNLYEETTIYSFGVENKHN